MRKACRLLCASGIVALLAGCSTSMNNPNPVTANAAAVSLSMTDDPPAGVNVLFFQVSLTDASLTPASGSPVSLLSGNAPVQIDVTQLQALSAFLSAANVPAGTYNSLSLTFANPQLVIFNHSDTALGSSCAVGTVCQLTPTLSSATVNFTSSPFPATVSANNPLGFMVDFHLNTVIQSDLSVDLAAANGVTIKQLSQPGSAEPPEFGAVSGTVGAPNTSNNSFPLITRWGRTFTIQTNSSTTYSNFPSSACSAAGFSCLAQGEVVRVHVASFAPGGVLTADTVSYIQSSSQQVVQGTVIGVTPPVATNTSAPWTVRMLLHWHPEDAATALSLGGVATVNVSNSAKFSIDNGTFTIPSTFAFTSPQDLTVGQQLQVDVDPGTLGATTTSGMMTGGWGPPHTMTFTTSTVQLEPSQITGMVGNLGAPNFTLGFNFSFFPWPQANAVSAVLAVVNTTQQTTYSGFTPESFSGLSANDLVSVSGWVFPPQTFGNPPAMVAQKIVLRPGHDF